MLRGFLSLLAVAVMGEGANPGQGDPTADGLRETWELPVQA